MAPISTIKLTGCQVIRYLFAIIAVLQVFNNLAEAELTCRDENGNPVDWYIGYKFPRLKKSRDSRFRTGYAYAYLTSEDAKSRGDFDEQLDDPPTLSADTRIFLYQFRGALKRHKELGPLLNVQPKVPKRRTRSMQAGKGQSKLHWSVSDYLLTDPESVIMKTLEIAYNKNENSNLNRVFYNDDPPVNEENEKDTKANNRRAHAKGVLLMDDAKATGVWLTHSIPQFPPPVNRTLKFGSNSVKFGQTFMCITFNLLDSGKKIVDHLINMRALVYERSLSDKVQQLIPDLEDLEHEDNVKGKRFSSIPKLSQIMVSKGGQVMHLYSKSSAYDDDMYSSWIDHELGSPLYVETWRLGAGNPLSSSCPKKDYHVNNVEDLKYDSDQSWSFKKDHSKWAITDESDPGIVCIGDQNRMESQFKRGGGTVCIKCPTCWSVFSSTIQDIEPCPVSTMKKKPQKLAGGSTVKKI